MAVNNVRNLRFHP